MWEKQLTDCYGRNIYYYTLIYPQARISMFLNLSHIKYLSVKIEINYRDQPKFYVSYYHIFKNKKIIYVFNGDNRKLYIAKTEFDQNNGLSIVFPADSYKYIKPPKFLNVPNKTESLFKKKFNSIFPEEESDA